MRKNENDAMLWWQQTVGEVAPVGHALRYFLSDRWIRFHSLPGSKRYAETASEMAEIVRRHTKVAEALFALGEQIFIFRSRPVEYDPNREEVQQLMGLPLSDGAISLPANPGVVPPDDDDYYRASVLTSSWPPAFFSDLVEAVAKEDEFQICFVSPASGSAYCPYDGGLDVFPSLASRAALKEKFARWMPSRSDGL